MILMYYNAVIAVFIWN